METEFGIKEDEWPQLFDLISNEKNWFKGDVGGGDKSLGAPEEKKLELSLAPPGGEGWPAVEEKLENLASVLPSSCSSNLSRSFHKNTFVGTKRVFFDKEEKNTEGLQQEQLGLSQLPIFSGFGTESSLKGNGRVEESHDKGVHVAPENGALVSSRSQTRSSPVVGWPPIHSFRKKIAVSSSKPSDGSQNAAKRGNASRMETSKKGLFVKINVDGIPIGRKLDLNAYKNYEKLSTAVEELFFSLLSAQRDPAVSGSGISEDEKRAFTGLLDGSGEYTLVYEDDEGDRMLVGDVPWDMFVSTAKRLRVLKNSELSALFPGAVNRRELHSVELNRRKI